MISLKGVPNYFLEEVNAMQLTLKKKNQKDKPLMISPTVYTRTHPAMCSKWVGCAFS